MNFGGPIGAAEAPRPIVRGLRRQLQPLVVHPVLPGMEVATPPIQLVVRLGARRLEPLPRLLELRPGPQLIVLTF